MKFYPQYTQSDFSEIVQLIQFCPTCLLQTLSKNNQIQNGIFNPIYSEKKIFLHLNRKDEQVVSLKNSKEAKIVFQDILAILPSYWVDEKYAGAATSYYRYAELNCSVRLIEDPTQQIPYLQTLMQAFQPEGCYQEVNSESEIYGNKLKTILVAEFQIDSFQAKWKLGQNRSVEVRKNIAQRFRNRNQGNDNRCAKEIERWIERNS